MSWISVKDKLPEIPTSVCAKLSTGIVIPALFSPMSMRWRLDLGTLRFATNCSVLMDVYTVEISEKVTHWCKHEDLTREVLLPEPGVLSAAEYAKRDKERLE